LLNTVSIDSTANTATIGGGALVKEVVDEAYKNKVHVATGTCNSVGAVGACLGGGVGRMQGLYGLGIDNMISARIIPATGKAITVSAKENPDLWWGLRGAGHGFGIVSSLTIKTHPQINDGMHWLSTLVFTPDKIDAISEAINGLDWDQGMALHVFFMPVPPAFQVCILLSSP
jgi:FAD/FMN-containing dehydrogenase